MKLIRYILLFCLMPAAPALAQSLAGSQVGVDNKSFQITDDGQVVVGMDITIPADMEISSNRVATFTPVLHTPDSTYNKVLPAVYVYGRKRYIIHRRDNDLPNDAYQIVRRDNGTEQVIDYVVRVPYEQWMNHSDLDLQADLCGCANCDEEEDVAQVGVLKLVPYQVQPAVAFVSPEVEEIKLRAEEGRAYLDFPVNSTRIIPDYRRNTDELAAIKATVDVVRNDTNTHITEIDITGYASPEGSYATNTRLAQGRAEALKKYVMQEYGFSDDFIKVNSVPEDWEGLRKYIADNNIQPKDELLAIIDDSEEDNYDVKEGRIRQIENGTVYAQLLKDIYPALRHSDYKVRYTVKGIDVESAKKIIKTRPQLLSLQEMYQVAQTYEKGSEEFNEVFDVAVRMFPADATANMNAAAMELQRGNADQAKRYLDKSDKAAAATLNNWGVYYLLQKDYDQAESYFNQAKEKGSAEADTNLQEVAKKRQDILLFGK